MLGAQRVAQFDASAAAAQGEVLGADDRPGLVSCLAVYVLRGPNYYTRTSVVVAATYAELERDAQIKLEAEYRRVELRVFAYRLALTLPLLVVAGWLFVKKRKSTYWPFVWGFIFFALFAFFVELVPYLPSYGGYVRYVVGIVLTVLVGRYAIVALNRYLARQKLAEQQPDQVRREELSYDTALARLAKSVCPGCERPVDLKNNEIDFCPHCGIGLFDHCGNCDTRKSAFSKFCHACGTSAANRVLPALGTAEA